MTGTTEQPEPDDVPWLSPDELAAWMPLTALLQTLPAALDTQLKRDAGLNRFEYLILAGLSESPGRSLLMSELAEFAVGSLSRLSHAVDRLERQRWVRRQPLAGNARQTEVVLTDEGWDKVVRTAPAHVREARRLVVDRLTADQLAALEAIAHTLVAGTHPRIAAMIRERSRGPAAG